MDGTDIGDRMKIYEQAETGRFFFPTVPVYARIDGRSFSRFTKGLQRPYDERMIHCMVETTKYLVDEMDAKIGYTQSDEISLCWISNNVNSQLIFNGKIHKLTSILPSLATAKFGQMVLKELGEEFYNRLPVFDARVIQLPSKMETANMFLWRAMDATKNAVSMAAHHYFSHKSLHGLNSKEKQEKLFQERGINFNDYPTAFKQGTFVQRKLVDVWLDDSRYLKIPEDKRPESRHVQRHSIETIDMPIFSKVTNRIEVMFDGEEPKTQE